MVFINQKDSILARKLGIYFFFLIYFLLVVRCEPPKRIVMGSLNQMIEVQSDCEQFEILTNYKHVALEIKEIKNIEVVLITDKILDSCNINQCQEDSNICQIRSVVESSQIKFDTKMCIGSIYINVKKAFNTTPEADGSTKFSFSLSTSYITGGSCLYIHENAFAYCGESNVEECRLCRKPGCTVIQCGSETSGPVPSFNKEYELCVPYTTSDKEKLEKCLSFQGVTTYKSTGQCEYDDLDGYSTVSVFLIGVIVIIILVFCLALIKYQCPPFAVPYYMPEFLFPRENYENFTRGSMDRQLDSVFSSNNRDKF